MSEADLKQATNFKEAREKLLAAKTEMEAVRKEFAELKRVLNEEVPKTTVIGRKQCMQEFINDRNDFEQETP